jgi:hypothetical protein
MGVMMKASSKFAGQVFLARHSFKMDCLETQPDWLSSQDKIQGMIGDVVMLRVAECCTPVFSTLNKLECLFGAIK